MALEPGGIVLIRGPIGCGKSTLANEIRKRLPEASLVDYDVFKRMADHRRSTEWRQRLAFDTALFLTGKLLEVGRTVVLDVHSAKEYQYVEMRRLADERGARFLSVLLRPTLAACLEFVRGRAIPDIEYGIDEEKVRAYYDELYEVAGETVIDSAAAPIADTADQVLGLMSKTGWPMSG